MALTNGQMQVLYLLLASRSQTRFSMEGLFGQTFGSAGPGAAQNQGDIDSRLDQQLARIFPGKNKTHADLKDSTLLLPGAGTSSGGVTSDHKRLRAAIGLDAVYDPASDPCPSDFSRVSGIKVQVNEESKIIAGILSMIP